MLATIIIIIFLVVSSSGPSPPPQAYAALNFSFPSIGTTQGGSFIFTREAYVTTDGIQLTPNERNRVRTEQAGQATYPEPFHLWDKATGELASFETNFSFVINSMGANNYGDGLAFFLVPNASVLPDAIGGGFGLTNMSNISNLNFVAVEFDTYYNSQWDPPVATTTHVGIDHNSVSSANYSIWGSAIRMGRPMNAWISYHNVLQRLTVVFSNYSTDNLSVPDSNATLVYNVDLRNWLPEWVSFGFTASTGINFEQNTIKSWSFNSTDIPGTSPTTQNDQPPPPPPPPPPPVIKDNKNKIIRISLAVGSSALVIIIIILAWIVVMRRRRRRRRKKKRTTTKEEEEEEEIVAMKDFSIIDDVDLDRGNGPRRFSYDELCVATNNFSEEQKLGEGGFGSVYRGLLKNDQGTHIDMAVKKVSANSKQGVKEYLSEVRIISKLRHRNLVQLLGWCHEKRELLLVYEFLSNGSLDQHIYYNNSRSSHLLDWATRMSIARGLASALLYLHEEWEQCVVHRDVKSSNVMLDSSFNPKLGDFGLARFVDHGKGSQTTVPAGTLGYMAPECYTTGQANKESDVFSFGIVALEIATGRKPIDHKCAVVRLVEWVWGLYGSGELLTGVDPKLSSDFIESQMVRLMVVGLWCAHPDCDLRPSIRQAMLVLNFEAPMPVLPTKMPVPMYSPPPPPLPLENAVSISNSSSSYPNNIDIEAAAAFRSYKILVLN
ncbi:L-type lectin-domain containing receptor kinase IX.1-like [Impatiens glandulifera]|uniref:L-type lectin-domain containing receptor kinase IX.1-like n=1 Tax=Impatiens glandulifera TaxID=253017 RepID=UPI001FB07447|nr:L-type lectin-domain containing receptor kinase IX.1-like [Impatiens glandulifera]